MTLLAALVLLAASAPALAQDTGPGAPEPARAALDEPPPPARPGVETALRFRPLEELAARAPGLAHVLALGDTPGGSPLSALLLAEEPAEPADRRGLLVVSGLDGRRVLDAALLHAVAESLLARDDLAARLGGRALLLLPSANPGGLGVTAAQWGDGPGRAGTGRPDDADRDGRTDEDGPGDVDGDGRVLWMAVPDGKGEWVRDEHEARAFRKARTGRGERGTHRLLREGRDDDGDGEHGEDDGDGVLLDRNFPHGFAEHEPRSGRWPVSEPEARALVDLVLAHPGLSAVLVVGDADTLAKTPAEAKRVERGGFTPFRAPLDGLLEDDVETLREWSRRARQAGLLEHLAEGEGPRDGSFLAWVYHQAGRWPLGLRAFATPETLPDAEEKKKEEKEEKEAAEDGPGREGDVGAEEPAIHDESGAAPGEDDPARAAATADEPEDAPAGVPGGDEAAAGEEEDAGDEAAAGDEADEAPADPPPADDQPTSDPTSPVPAAVLAWLDRQSPAPAAFHAFTPFEHEELGAVEIGGFALDPEAWAGWDAEAHEARAAALAEFLLAALDLLPAVAFEDVQVTARGGGVYALSAALVSTGVLPTAPAFGAEAGVVRPVRVQLRLPDGARRLQGPPQVLVPRLDGGGGRQELRWTILGAPGQTLQLTADADTVADLSLEIVLP